ncbi:MAG: SprB repeat-containing protein, partial [Bacteroidota bacterium]
VEDGYILRVAPTQTITYQITNVTDPQNTCPAIIESEHTIEVKPLEIEATATSQFGNFNVSCPASTDGTASVTIDGGVEPYVYAWSNGAFGENIGQLAAGAYAITVTDANGCFAEDSLTLTEPDVIMLNADIIPPTCAEDNNGAIIITGISGGTPPYEYSTDGVSFRLIGQNNITLGNLTPGNYNFSILDVNDCRNVTVLNIPQPTPTNIDLGPDLTVQFGGSLMLEPTLDFQVDTFSWTPPGSIINPN